MKTDTKFLLFFFVLFSSYISAQESLNIKKANDSISIHKITHAPKWEGGLLLGATSYSGDLEFAVVETRLIAGFFVRRAISNYFGINFSLMQGVLGGSDSHSTGTPWRVVRNFAFKTPLTEIAVRGEYHFLGITHKVMSLSSGASVMDEASQQSFRMRTRKVSPYIYVGGGIAIVNPKTNFNDKLLPNPVTAGFRINADKTNTKPMAHLIVPFGGGLRIPFVNSKTILTLEGGFRPTFSDDIDGVSFSGNPNVNDWYFIGTVGLSKTLGYTKDSDRDGIPDKYDLCPFLKGDEKLQGCPDRDGDGVTDDKDACPSIAGLTIYEGCPDTDGDGIIDKYDDCPTEVGIGRFKGCPTEKKSKDSLKVAPLTSLDTVKIVPFAQPLKPIAITQTAERKDSLNLTLNKLEKPVVSPVNTQVITQSTPPQYIPEKPTIKPTEIPVTAIDTTVVKIDKPLQVVAQPLDTPQYILQKLTTKPTDMPLTAIDTTIAKIDKPIQVAQPLDTPQYIPEKPTTKPIKKPIIDVDTKESKTNKPSQVVMEPPVKSYFENATILDTIQNAFNIVRNHYTISPIYFGTSQSSYKSGNIAILDEIASILLENPTRTLLITGHTDITGTATGNQVLSVKRAKMCFDYLKRKGVPSRQMFYKGLGQTRPAADNDTEEARLLNRRVEFEIVDKN